MSDNRVVINDDLPEYCSQEVLPDIDDFYPIPVNELPVQMKTYPLTHIIMTTRGVDIDVAGLPSLLKIPVLYIGVIVSRKR